MTPRDAPRAEDVVAEVEARWGAPCRRCRVPIVGHEVVMSLFLGFGDEPRCAPCLAETLGRAHARFVVDAARTIRRLDCYRAGWEHADARTAPADWPTERVPASLRMADVATEIEGTLEDEVETAARPDAHAASAERFDAGDMACGELVLKLRKRIRGLAAGALLHVTAHDVAAPEDLPAWCRLTGHRMRRAEHPEYWIERRPRTEE